MLAYDANQNEFLLSMLHTAGAIVVKDDEEYHILSTRMNMAQLALIKRLDCVKRVITDEGTNPFLAEEAKKAYRRNGTCRKTVSRSTTDKANRA